MNRHPCAAHRFTPCRAAFAARLLCTSLAVGAAAATLPGAAHAQPAAEAAAQRSYAIPPGPLGLALNRLGRESGALITFTPELVAGAQTHGASGGLSVAQALAALLAGTGLEATAGPGGAYALRRVPEARPSTGTGAASLAEVRVTAEAERSATSEGTGTYAAQAATLFKGAHSLREIPQSVSVLTREQMDDQGITRLDAAYTQMAGVRLDGYTNEGRIMARGFEVSTQVDGIPAAGSGLFRLDPALYDRVEMVRGPSGLFAGSGEPGGSINLVRKRPANRFALSGNLSYGSWNNARAELDAGGPLNADGTLRGRAVAVLQDKDQFYEAAHEKRQVLYGILELDPSPDGTAGLSVTHMRNRGNAFWGLPRYSDGTLPGRRTFVGVTDVDSAQNVTEVLLDYEHRFGNGWRAKAALGQRKEKMTWAGVYGYGFADPATGLADGEASHSAPTQDYRYMDFNVSGPFQWLGRRHEASLGYNHSVGQSNNDRRYSAVFTGGDILRQHDWGGSRAAWNSYGYATDTRQSGFYGNVRLRVQEPLAVILGGRYSRYDYRSRSRYTTPWVDGQKASGEFTPYAGVVWDVSPQLSLYGSYAEIFVPQSARDHTGAMLKPRVGGQVELGVKGSFLNDRLNASLAVFQLRDENRAMDDMDPAHVCSGSWSGRCSTAAGKIQSRGFEAEVSGTPMPGLNLSASYTNNRSIYLTDADPARVGQRVDAYRNPRHLLKLWAQYRFADAADASALSGWTVGGGVIAQSGLYDSERVQQGSHAVVSARLGYRINRNASVSFDIDNLFDRTYLTELNDGGYYNIYGAPRSFRVALHYKFD
jgi:TonB-dependent siderophore receptor